MRDRSLCSGERQHGADLEHIEEKHKLRYREACKYLCSTDNVSDLGCGVGYGTRLLSLVANQVRGIDDSEEAIAFAKEHYSGDNISYAVIDLNTALSNTPMSKADVIVAFEVIEHLPSAIRLFDIFKALSPRLIILSTPHLKCPMGGNQFHYRHFGMDELISSFWDIGYKPKRAELIYYGTSLCNFITAERR